MPEHEATGSPAETLLAEKGAEWLAMVARRHSRRTYDGFPVDDAALSRLAEVCSAFRPYADCRAVLVAHPRTDVFYGVVGSYGKVVDAPHLLVFVASEKSDFPDQHIGYVGEAVLLEATRLELDTCWVGGFFREKLVAELLELKPGERVFAVSPVGFATREDSRQERLVANLGPAKGRRPLSQIAPGIERGGWPSWAVAAAETVRLAPSAMNRQPWRLHFDGSGLVLAKDSVFETPKVSKRLDIGIAMLHAELAARAYGVLGRWTDLPGTDVARYDAVAP